VIFERVFPNDRENWIGWNNVVSLSQYSCELLSTQKKTMSTHRNGSAIVILVYWIAAEKR
jgi:hypothetical protein